MFTATLKHARQYGARLARLGRRYDEAGVRDVLDQFSYQELTPRQLDLACEACERAYKAEKQKAR